MCRCECAPMAVEDGIGPHLHIPAYACVFMFVSIRVWLYHACQPVAHGFAATTPARAASVPAGWQRGETLSAAHPGEEGLPAHLLSHHLGPCVCGCPAPDPLGSSQCRRTSALSNLLVKREKTTSNRRSFLTLCYAFSLHTVTHSVISGGSNRKNIIIYHNCIECTSFIYIYFLNFYRLISRVLIMYPIFLFWTAYKLSINKCTLSNRVF